LGKWRYSSTHYLTSALDEGKWSASRPGRFTPRERARGTHWIGGWVGPRTILDTVVKRKIPSPRRESIRRTPIVQPVAQPPTAKLFLRPATTFTTWSVRVNTHDRFQVVNLWGFHVEIAVKWFATPVVPSFLFLLFQSEQQQLITRYQLPRSCVTEIGLDTEWKEGRLTERMTTGRALKNKGNRGTYAAGLNCLTMSYNSKGRAQGRYNPAGNSNTDNHDNFQSCFFTVIWSSGCRTLPSAQYQVEQWMWTSVHKDVMHGPCMSTANNLLHVAVHWNTRHYLTVCEILWVFMHKQYLYYFAYFMIHFTISVRLFNRYATFKNDH
jgi:hypothetical protein